MTGQRGTTPSVLGIAFGHAVYQLSAADREKFAASCARHFCTQPVAMVVGYRYAAGQGRPSTPCGRAVCFEHGQEFAARHELVVLKQTPPLAVMDDAVMDQLLPALEDGQELDELSEGGLVDISTPPASDNAEDAGAPAGREREHAQAQQLLEAVTRLLRAHRVVTRVADRLGIDKGSGFPMAGDEQAHLRQVIQWSGYHVGTLVEIAQRYHAGYGDLS